MTTDQQLYDQDADLEHMERNGFGYAFSDYQEATRATAIYPEALTGSLTALTYLGLGLGEAGEIQGKLKKILRDSGGEVTYEARAELLKEIGDLQWYLTRLADELDADMGVVALANIGKLASRKTRGVLGGNGDNR